MKRTKLFKITLVALALCCTLVSAVFAEEQSGSTPDVVVKIGTDEYASIKAAVDASTSPTDVLVLQKDVVYSEKADKDYALLIDKSLTLDLNGFTITSTEATSALDPKIKLIKIGNTNKNISVTIIDSSDAKTGLIKLGTRGDVSAFNSDYETITLIGNTDLTVDGAKIYGCDAINTKYGGTAIKTTRDYNYNINILNGAEIKGGDCIKDGITVGTYKTYNCTYQGEAGKGMYVYGTANIRIDGSSVLGGNGIAQNGTQEEYISGGSNFANGAEAIYFYTSTSTLEIADSTIKSGDSDLNNTKAAIYLSSSTLSVTNSTIEGGSCHNNVDNRGIAGHAIGAGANATINIKSSEILGGSSSGSWLGCGIETPAWFNNANDKLVINIDDSVVSGGDRTGTNPKASAPAYGNAIYLSNNNNTNNIEINLKNTELYAAEGAYGVIGKADGSVPVVVNIEGTVTVDVAGQALSNTTIIPKDANSAILGNLDNSSVKYGNIPETITVGFEKVDDNTFDIVLSADIAINEFVAAELKFDNTSLLESGAKMIYEIVGTNDISVERNLEKEGVYLFNLKADSDRPISDKIVLGQVSFIGFGEIEFAVNDSYENTVTATTFGTHLADYYTTQNNKLIIGAAATSKVELPKRDIEISFDFKHPVDTLATEEYLGVKAVLKDIYGNETEKALAGAAEVITFEAVPVGRVTLTLSAPGYRTYVYTTVVEEDAAALTLNFWTDVKRDTLASPLAEIEAGKGAIATSFLVGDIAMDYIVDKYDLAAVTSYYGTYGITAKTAEEIAKLVKYDLNRDGCIDITDVGYVLHTMGF